MILPNNKPYTFDRVIRILISAGFLFGLIWLLGYLSDVLIPFAVAFLLAYLINPLTARIQKKINSRVVSVLISLIIVIVAVSVFIVIFVPMIVKEVAHMGQIVSDLAENAEIAQKAAKILPADFWQVIKDLTARQEFRDLFKSQNFWRNVQTVVSKLLPGVWGLISGTAAFFMGLLGLAVIGLYLIFLLIDYDKFSRGWKDMIPPSHREAFVGLVEDFESAMNNYFRGQTVVASICGVLFAIGFALIGLPLGILLGLFIGLLNMVPYLQLIGFIPAFLLAVFHAIDSGMNLWLVLGLTGLVFAVVQIIQDAILTPKIMGKVTGLSPAMIMLSLSIWGKLLGFLGLIIALPMTYLLLVYYRRFLATSQTATTD
jgi:predicted PurR-regulated permease PerM